MQAPAAMPRVLSLLLATTCLFATGCASAGGYWVEIGGARYDVEIADDDEERSRGLMFRDHLPSDAGMLFIHEREEPRSYWMMNTRIALDILYFDSGLRLVSQRRDTPPCPPRQRCPAYPSAAPAQYVLELNAGEAAKLGLEDGAVLRLAPEIVAENP